MCTTFGDKRHVQMETLRFLDKFEWSPSYRPSITYKELKQYADCLFDFWSRDFVTEWSLRRQWSAQKLLTKFLDIFQRPNDASLKTTIFKGQCFDETKFQLEIITEQRVPPHCGLATNASSSFRGSVLHVKLCIADRSNSTSQKQVIICSCTYRKEMLS